jgi:hypothetical protein
MTRLALLAVAVAFLAGGAAPATKPATGPAGELAVEFVSIKEGQGFPALVFNLTNATGRGIKSIRGQILPYDQAGKRIGMRGIVVVLPGPIKPGAAVRQEGRWPIEGELTKRLQQDPKGVAFRWRTEQAAYE